MSIKVMTDVWAYADCSGSELLVLLAMADFSDDAGRNIYPSMTTLAQKARLSEPQARRVVKKLVKLKLIEIVEVGGWKHGRNRANSYRILLETLDERRGIKLTPPPSHGRDHGGIAHAPTVVSSMGDDPSSDPSYEPPVEKMRPRRAQKDTKRKNYRPDEYSDIILG